MIFSLEDAANKAQSLFPAGAGRNLDGVAVLGAAFGTADAGDSGELRERAAAEGDPVDWDDDNSGPGKWERGMLPGDTGVDEIQEETSGTVQVMGTDLNTLDAQDAGASGHKESAPSDGRSLCLNDRTHACALARSLSHRHTIFLHASTKCTCGQIFKLTDMSVVTGLPPATGSKKCRAFATGQVLMSRVRK